MLKDVELSKEGAFKVLKGTPDLYYSDILGNIKSCIPGEWVILNNQKKNIKYIGYVNPLVNNSTNVGYILTKLTDEFVDEESFLTKYLEKAIHKRNLFEGYKENSRLVYGSADELPGLIVDSYVNYVIIQINTAGMDRHREFIKSFLESKFPSKKIIILDNLKYRERELLPQYETDRLTENLEIIENNMSYSISPKNLQKVGYYYDHRENRNRASRLIRSMDRKFEKGLDLFSYVGSWGLNLLSAGCANIKFVDQGDFSKEIAASLKLNNYENAGTFYREDVFNFLKKEVIQGNKYDLICSDPPAFCKSKNEQRKAYEGYLKLHKNIFNLLEKDSVFIACSCTYYIDFETFERNISEAAMLTGRKIQLIDIGIQGHDHPTKKLIDKNTYLKYFSYLVE